jgi:hypothetical protein
MNLLAPPKRNLSGAWPENTNPLGTERRGGKVQVLRGRNSAHGQPTRAEGGGGCRHHRTDGGGRAQPGLHRAIPVRDQAAYHGTDRSRWAQDAGLVPDGASDAGRTVRLS